MISRRHMLKSALAGFAMLKAGLLLPANVFAAWPAKVFSITKPDETIQELFGERVITTTNQIDIQMPPGAENGAIVPITIKTYLSNVQSISLIAEKNPIALLGQFTFKGKGSGEYLRSRIKLAESSHVIVVIEANCQLYTAKQYIEVLKGGCD